MHVVDLERIYQIENDRSYFMRNMHSYQPDDIVEKIQSLLSDMQVFMESYGFEDYMRDRYVDGVNFYDVQRDMPYTQGNLELCRRGCTIAFLVWRECIRKLGSTLPTVSAKEPMTKKIIYRLFSLVSSKIDYDKEMSLYKATCERLGWRYKSTVNFVSFAISRMKAYDLAFNCIEVGRARGSKSTLTGAFFEKIYQARGEDIMKDDAYKLMLDKQYILDNTVGIDAVMKGVKGAVNWFDDTHLVFDRRRSMGKRQVKETGDLNFYASMNYVNFYLMQNLSSLDSRITTIANVLILVIERGKGLMFSDSKWLPLFYDRFGFEIFEENPKLANNKDLAMKILKSQKEFICELHWKDRGAHLDDTGQITGADVDPFYAYVLSLKLKKQQMSVNREKEKDAVVENIRNGTLTKTDAIHDLYNRLGYTQAEIAVCIGSPASFVSTTLNKERREQVDARTGRPNTK